MADVPHNLRCSTHTMEVPSFLERLIVVAVESSRLNQNYQTIGADGTRPT